MVLVLHAPLVMPYPFTGDALLARLTGTRPICNSCKAAMFQRARVTDIIWSLSKFKKANIADLLTVFGTRGHV